MPIYEGTSQIQALMAMKDTLGRHHQEPAGASCGAAAQARWRALSSRDPLERRVARHPDAVVSAQQHLITRTAADKLKATAPTCPSREWPRRS